MNRESSALLKKFYQISGSFYNEELDAWLAKGGRVIGYYCSFLPEEIITAAGMMPYRIRAIDSRDTVSADVFLSDKICTFTRHSLNMALNGKYDFLSGMVWCTNCDHIRRTIDYWRGRVPIPFMELIEVTKTTGTPQVERYAGQLQMLIEKLEAQFDVQITGQKLREAIRLHNRKRALLKQLYTLRKSAQPVMTGADMLAVSVAATAIPPERCIELLEALWAEAQAWEPVGGDRVRLLIAGSELDDPEYLNTIEAQGAIIVNDSLCYGSRYCWAQICETGDPLTAIARYIVQEKPTCPRYFDAQDRQIGHVRRLVQEYRAEGVIRERLNFCDHWANAQLQYEQELPDAQIPLLTLDREYHLDNTGQLKTRMQAFLEIIREGRP